MLELSARGMNPVILCLNGTLFDLIFISFPSKVLGVHLKLDEGVGS